MVMINLFVGVMVNSLSEADELRRKLHIESAADHELALESKLATIESELTQLKALLKGRKH